VTVGNPWLGIPLSDYERHMALPGVGQAEMLSSELLTAVAAHRARSLAVIGCAGGNGFDRLASVALERVVGIDINPAFIEVARERHSASLHGLELYVGDIGMPLEIAPVDVVFAGLVLEYVELAGAMRTLRALCRGDGGHLIALLQLASRSAPPVSPSPYTSLATLGECMRLHQPKAVIEAAERAGFRRESERKRVLPSGKEFSLLTFAG
jgi:SAM-dependent methyltransferase